MRWNELSFPDTPLLPGAALHTFAYFQELKEEEERKANYY